MIRAPHLSRPRAPQAGITLIELFVVLLIMLMIAGGISRLLLSSWQSQDTITTQNEMQRRAQKAADEVVDRLRGATEITAGDSTSVTALYGNDDSVTYYLQNGALMRDRHSQATGVTTTDNICSSVSALDLGYLVRSGSGWATAATAVLAQSVKISVTLTSGSDRATESSVVKLRNKVSV